MKKIIVLVAALAYMIPLMSQDRMNQRRERIENIKIAFITKELDLTTSESQAFWPVYNEYQSRIQDLRKELRPDKKIEDLSTEEADQLMLRYLQNEQEKLRAEEKLFQNLKPIIGSQRVIKLKLTEEVFKRRVLEKLGDRKEGNGPRRKLRN